MICSRNPGVLNLSIANYSNELINLVENEEVAWKDESDEDESILRRIFLDVFLS